VCTSMPTTRANPCRLVLLGAPGVGKGTQADLLCEHFGLCHLATGDIFRSALTQSCECSPALKAALDGMRRGELVSDETVLAIISERRSCLRCGGGFVLDGFPRTVAQAEALDGMLHSVGIALNAVLKFNLSLDQIVARLSGRRTCPSCKTVFHQETRPPRKRGLCDRCGATLHQREDDRPEAIRVRMEAYQRTALPLSAYYAQRGLLVSIYAEGTPEEIFNCGLALLGYRELVPGNTPELK
jgi:adenylate kinase